MNMNIFLYGLSVGLAFAVSMAATFLYGEEMMIVVKKKIWRLRQWNN